MNWDGKQNNSTILSPLHPLRCFSKTNGLSRKQLPRAVLQKVFSTLKKYPHFDHKWRETILYSTPYSMPEILKGRSAKNFSILVTVNSSWQLLNQISKRNCKILLVPTKIFKNFWNSLGSLWPKNWSYKR